MVNVLDIKMFDKNLSHAIEIINEELKKGRENRMISATGAHGIVHSKKDPEFKSILNQFFFNLPDGMPVVWVGRLKGSKEMERCCGADFFNEMMKSSNNRGINHYFCGGKTGIPEKLKEVWLAKYGYLNIVGTYSPPFYEMSEEEIVELAREINSKKTDILWIGISTPKQEKFAYRLSRYTDVHFICTVGAAFDFHVGHVRQAPRWIQNIGMEWMFRLILEPRRLWKRYSRIVPLFIIYNFLEYLRGNFK